MSAHDFEITLEFGTKRGVLDVVDGPVKALLLGIEAKAAAAGTKMGMVIHTEEQIKHTIIIGSYAKKSAHMCSLSVPPKIPT